MQPSSFQYYLHSFIINIILLNSDIFNLIYQYFICLNVVLIAVLSRLDSLYILLFIIAIKMYNFSSHFTKHSILNIKLLAIFCIMLKEKKCLLKRECIPSSSSSCFLFFMDALTCDGTHWVRQNV